MIVRIEELEGVRPIATTSCTYAGEDISRIMNQPGVDGIAFIGFRQGEYFYEAAIGKRGPELLNDLMHLAAKPCPPFCPDSQL